MDGQERSGQATSMAEFLTMFPRFRTEQGIAYGGAFRPRPDDVLIATFAKAGTTWLQQIVHGLKTGGDMDFAEITQVIPWIEMAYDMGIDLDADQKGGLRGFKTHLGWANVPKGCRYICIIRDPCDTAVSFFNFMDGWFIREGAISIDDFVRDFIVQPYFEGGYWVHLMSWWAERNNPDVLLLTFEDVKEDHPGTVRRVADFLGLDVSPETLAVATEQSTFDFMKRHEHQFDDNLIVSTRNSALGIPPGVGSTKVASGRVGDHKQSLGDDSVALLARAWADTVEKELGFADYAELRASLGT